MLSALVLGVGLTVGASAMNFTVVPPPAAEPVILAASSVNVMGYRGLDSAMTSVGFTVDGVRGGDLVVPRVFAEAIPSDMAAIPSPDERKRVFIKLMLPLVLDANERLLVDRAHLIYLLSRQGVGQTLSAADRRWLNDMYVLFEVAPGDDEELLLRVDMIPPSLALAQAAQESGWGTSRFAHEGNAVFGQRVWQEGAGMVPEDRPAGEDHEVKSFDGLQASVLAYMVNLNRHQAYDAFRDLRSVLRADGEALDPMLLAGGLGGYSEEGRAYIEKLRDIIAKNELTDFDLARLADIRI